MIDKTKKEASANLDPLSGAPGAHPVGTGVGAAAGGIAGGAVGSMGGPVGAAVGMVAGAVAGGLGGKGVAEKMDPTLEETFWQNEYSHREYVEQGAAYETYRPAYRTGYEGYTRYPGKRYEEVESFLQRDYEKSRGNGGLPWDKARHATRDAWYRAGQINPDDADADGR